MALWLEIIIAVLLVGGAFFTFVASWGLLTLPDVYLWLSATSKAATLGVAGLLLGAGLFFIDTAGGSIFAQVIATIVFIFFTAPVGAHMIARAAYMTGEKPTEATLVDDLAGYYAQATIGKSRDTGETVGHDEEPA